MAPVTRLPGEPKAVPPAPRAPEAVAPVPQPIAAPRLLKAFMVQAGVFTSVQRAEELHAKLTLNGIPSVLEARVQAGPFKNREEAAAAREKMKALGIEAVMILPPKGGR
jgi:DedD protein